MARLSTQLRELVEGALLPLEGARLVASSGRLLGLAALPMVLTAVATAGAGVLAFLRGRALLGRVWQLAGPCTGCGPLWWAWSRLETVAFEAAFIVLVILAAAVAGLLASRVLAAPAMDALSREAMRVTDLFGVPLGERSLARQAWRSIVRATGHALADLAGAALLALVALVAGGAVVATPLQVGWAAAWLFVDTTLYPLQWVGEARLGEMLALVRKRPALSLGFAAGQAVLLFIPLAGLAVTPVAIAGACLLVARGAPAVEGSPEPAASAA